MARILNIQARLKPLVAQLRRLNVGRYVGTSEFDNIVLERNWDEAWEACKKEIRRQVVLVRLDRRDYTIEEDAFALMLNLAYEQDRDVFEELLTTVIQEFVNWKQESFNLDPICESVLSLGLHAGSRAAIRDAAERAKNKPTTNTIQKNKVNKNYTKNTEMGKNVFVVHGHDDARRMELCRILKDELGLCPKVVQEEPNDTIETILGKIERLAAECHVAIILMTADDEMKTGTKRARQNVILELGYFLGLWRTKEQRRIIILQAPEVETPSDISGVIYLSFTKEVAEVYMRMMKQLKYWGVEVRQ